MKRFNPQPFRSAISTIAPADLPWWRQPRMLGLGCLLVAMVVIAYLPALSAGFIWDDDQYVTRNPTLRDLAGLGRIWFEIGALPQYYPLVHTGFWLEYHIWGLNPVGFHAVNILLHAMAALLLWRVLVRFSVPSAWLAAALFAVHPVHVESVAWVTERKNVLSAVFYFAAALVWFYFRERQIARKPVGWFWAMAFLLFMAALLSKTVTCSLPAALLLGIWWREGRLTARDWRPLLPFFVAGAGLGFLTSWMEKHVVGAVGMDWNLAFTERVLIAGRALWFYIGKLLWPAQLTFVYERWEVSPSTAWQWLYPLAAAALVVVLWFGRKRFGRGPLVAILFFAGTLFPALGFIDVFPFRYSFVADHFQYLASCSVLILVAAGLAKLPRAVAAAGLLGLIVLTARQTLVYHDLETLWRDTLIKNPDCPMALNNLGALLTERGNNAAAEHLFRKALELKPDDEETLSNLAVMLSNKGDNENARRLLRESLSKNPKNSEAIANLGKILVAEGRYTEAVELFEKAVGLQPRRPEFHYNLGGAFASAGQSVSAISSYKEALRLRPFYPDAHNNLALALAGQGQTEEALAHYRRALELDPNHALAHNNLGQLLLSLRRTTEAVDHLQTAIRLRPEYVNAHLNLGNAFALQGDYFQAITQLNETLRLSPDHLMARRNLGLALARFGRFAEAAEAFRAVLRQQPDFADVTEQLRKLEGAELPAPRSNP